MSQDDDVIEFDPLDLVTDPDVRREADVQHIRALLRERFRVANVYLYNDSEITTFDRTQARREEIDAEMTRVLANYPESERDIIFERAYAVIPGYLSEQRAGKKAVPLPTDHPLYAFYSGRPTDFVPEVLGHTHSEFRRPN